jgi:rSAM/selenodomain-associated transferase 2
MHKISVIIPVYNEEKLIAENIQYIKNNGGSLLEELIVVDAGSTDHTVVFAKNAGATVCFSPKMGRAEQMNLGAKMAKSDILYFVHADTKPPETFANEIVEAVKNGSEIGCFRLKLDSKKKLFFINEWFTRFNVMWCRGGDQTLFTTKNLFAKLNGFDEKFVIMEEYDFILKAKKETEFKILNNSTLASARKYENNGWLKVMIANYIAYKMFVKKIEPQKIKEYYKAALK